MAYKIKFILGLILCVLVLYIGMKDIEVVETKQVSANEYFAEGGYWKNAVKVYQKPAHIGVDKTVEWFGKFRNLSMWDKVYSFIGRDTETLIDLIILLGGVLVMSGTALLLVIAFFFFLRCALVWLFFGVAGWLAGVPWGDCEGRKASGPYFSLLGGFAFGGIFYLLNQWRVHTFCKGEKIFLIIFITISLLCILLNIKSGAKVLDAVFRGITGQIFMGIYIQIFNVTIGSLLYLMLCEGEWISVLFIGYLVLTGGDIETLMSGFSGAAEALGGMTEQTQLARWEAEDRKDEAIIRGIFSAEEQKEAMNRIRTREINRAMMYYGDENKKADK